MDDVVGELDVDEATAVAVVVVGPCPPPPRPPSTDPPHADKTRTVTSIVRMGKNVLLRSALHNRERAPL